MNKRLQNIALAMAVVVMTATPAFAKKPDSPGNSGKNKAEQHQGEAKHGNDNGGSYQGFFDADRQSRIRNYYTQMRNSGNCPPGLAKKNNGCQPPGQAKKWQRGHRLPDDVVYHDLPSALLHELGRTPEGQKIVRVGTDLLLISVATGVVIDALEDLDDIF